MWIARSRIDLRPFSAVMAGVISLAWLSLWLWGQSPYARLLSHQELGEVGLQGSYLTLLWIFVPGWTLMTVAMMLPTSLPLIYLFRSLVEDRRDRLQLLFLLVIGYLIVWSLFGVLAHVSDWRLHLAVSGTPWFYGNAWIIGTAITLMAGLYQFTPLKYRCLDKCRSPFVFVSEHWRGNSEKTQAFSLGVRHGVFCVGCCWSLMLLMFAIGVGNIGWMLLLGTIMAVEKNVPWGRRLSMPLGITLIGVGVVGALSGTRII